MKRLFFLLIVIAASFSACKKSSSINYKNTATITGPDLTMTVCSGGYWIDIDGLSAKYRFRELPVGSGIDLSTATFPIRVKLNWHADGDPPSPCGVIIIDAIAKAN
jgi:hypothetical protein